MLWQRRFLLLLLSLLFPLFSGYSLTPQEKTTLQTILEEYKTLKIEYQNKLKTLSTLLMKSKQTQALLTEQIQTLEKNLLDLKQRLAILEDLITDLKKQTEDLKSSFQNIETQRNIAIGVSVSLAILASYLCIKETFINRK